MRERSGVRNGRAHTTDPRSNDTRARLCEAFERLVVRDGYAAATAAGIATEAGVSRSAFYDHFGNPLDVAVAVVEDLYATISAANREARASGLLDGPAGTQDALRRMAGHMSEFRPVYLQLLLSPASGAVLRLLLDTFTAESLAAVRHARPDLSGRGVAQATRVIAGAVLSTMVWWLQEDDHRPAEVLAAELFALLPEWFTEVSR